MRATGTAWAWLLALAGIGMAAIAPAPAAWAAGWPAKPITLVVAYPPGGGTDNVARLMAKDLADRLGVAVIVDNRGGAGGRIGTQTVANAAPDGYTILFGTGAELTMAPATVRKMPYDPLRDLEPITQIAGGPYLVIASKDFAPNNITELVAFAKAHPEQLNYSSGGLYSATHMAGLLLNDRTGIKTVHVPYRGSGPSLVGLMSNEVQYTFNTPSSSLDLVTSGKVKILGVSAAQRLGKLPAVPTIAESGYPGFTAGSWYGLLAPKGTPRDVVQRLHDETVRFLQMDKTRQALEGVYIVPIGSTPAQFRSYLGAEIARYRELMARLKLQPE